MLSRNFAHLESRPPFSRTMPVGGRALPHWFWGALFVSVVAVPVGIVFPVVGIALGTIVIGLFLVAATIRKPLRGMIATLLVFPLYPTLRGMLTVFNLPIPTAGLRFWPELILLYVFAGICAGCIVRRYRLRIIAYDLPGLIWIAGAGYGAVISLATQHPFFTVFGLHYAVTPILFYLAMRWIEPTPKEGEKVIRVFFITYALLAIVSLLAAVLHPRIFLLLADANRPDLARYTITSMRLGIDHETFWRLYSRMQSFLFEENVWGSLSGFVSLLCLARFADQRKVSPWLFLLTILSTLCLILSISRGSMIGWVVGVGVLLLLRGQHRLRVQFIVIAFLIIAGGAVTILRDDPRTEGFFHIWQRSGLDKGSIGGDRKDQWEHGTDIFLLNPSGTGLGTVGYAASNTGIYNTQVADGNYFAVAGETGIVGLVILATCLIGTNLVLLTNLQRHPAGDRWLGMGLTAYLCDISAHAVTANTFEYYYTFPVFWMLTGLFVSLGLRNAKVLPTTRLLLPATNDA